MENIDINAKIVIFGTIRMLSYQVTNGPRVNRSLLVKRAKIVGLLMFDYFNKYSEIYNELQDWFKKGKLNNKEDVSH